MIAPFTSTSSKPNTTMSSEQRTSCLFTRTIMLFDQGLGGKCKECLGEPDNSKILTFKGFKKIIFVKSNLIEFFSEADLGMIYNSEYIGNGNYKYNKTCIPLKRQLEVLFEDGVATPFILNVLFSIYVKLHNLQNLNGDIRPDHLMNKHLSSVFSQIKIHEHYKLKLAYENNDTYMNGNPRSILIDGSYFKLNNKGVKMPTFEENCFNHSSFRSIIKFCTIDQLTDKQIETLSSSIVRDNCCEAQATLSVISRALAP